ncbi:DUF2398 family protein [Streptomyces flaveolus]|uniref:DUF2398 family protein n=1 Tax=Streptomyces flaveolus TaxID=67297 RepID=UPI00342B1684
MPSHAGDAGGVHRPSRQPAGGTETPAQADERPRPVRALKGRGPGARASTAAAARRLTGPALRCPRLAVVLLRGRALARLRKAPGIFAEATHPVREATHPAREASRAGAPFTRRRYVLLCLALAVLEGGEPQIALGRLAEQVVLEDPLQAEGVTAPLKILGSAQARPKRRRSSGHARTLAGRPSAARCLPAEGTWAGARVRAADRRVDGLEPRRQHRRGPGAVGRPPAAGRDRVGVLQAAVGSSRCRASSLRAADGGPLGRPRVPARRGGPGRTLCQALQKPSPLRASLICLPCASVVVTSL